MIVSCDRSPSISTLPSYPPGSLRRDRNAARSRCGPRRSQPRTRVDERLEHGAHVLAVQGGDHVALPVQVLGGHVGVRVSARSVS